MSETRSVTVELEFTRHYMCGRWYAYEVGRVITCPYCSRAKVDEANQRLEAERRINRSLRGLVTRMKGKKK